MRFVVILQSTNSVKFVCMHLFQNSCLQPCAIRGWEESGLLAWDHACGWPLYSRCRLQKWYLSWPSAAEAYAWYIKRIALNYIWLHHRSSQLCNIYIMHPRNTVHVSISDYPCYTCIYSQYIRDKRLVWVIWRGSNTTRCLEMEDVI